MWCWELCRTSCVTGKHHTNWATSLTPFLPFCDWFRVNILYVPVLIIFRIYFIVNSKSLTWNFVMENWISPIVFGWVWMCVCLCTYLSSPLSLPFCVCVYVHIIDLPHINNTGTFTFCFISWIEEMVRLDDGWDVAMEEHQQGFSWDGAAQSQKR